MKLNPMNPYACVTEQQDGDPIWTFFSAERMFLEMLIAGRSSAMSSDVLTWTLGIFGGRVWWICAPSA